LHVCVKNLASVPSHGPAIHPLLFYPLSYSIDRKRSCGNDSNTMIAPMIEVGARSYSFTGFIGILIEQIFIPGESLLDELSETSPIERALGVPGR